MRGFHQESREAWANRHNSALASPRGFERPVVHMLRAISAYRGLHLARYESDVMDDYVIGDGVKEIAAGLRTLLNGETGRLDCGTIDAYLVEIVGES